MSKGIQFNGTVIDRYKRFLAPFMQYIDIAHDPTCLLHLASLVPVYFNTAFALTYHTNDTSTLIDILKGQSTLKEELQKIWEEGIKQAETSRSFRLSLPYSTNEEFELTLSVTDKPQFLVCSIRKIKLKSQDISLTNENYQKVLSSLKNYKKIIDSSPSAILKTDLEGIITFSSSYSEYIHGEFNSPLVGTHIDTHFSLDDSTIFEKLKQKLINQKKGNGLLIAHALNIHGNHKEVEIRYSLSNNEAYQSIILNYYDITEQVQAKTNLRESKNRIQSLLDLSSMPFIEISEEGIILRSSSAVFKCLGIDKNKIAENSIYSIIPPNRHASFSQFIQTIGITKNSHYSHTINVLNDINKKQVIQLTGKVIQHNKQTGNTIMLICENITEKLNSELALIEKDKILYTLLENSPFGIYAVDLQYNIIFINKNATNSFKQNQKIDISISDNLKEKINPEQFEDWNKSFRMVFNGESFNSVGQIASNPNKIVNNRYAPLKDAFGDVIGCIEVSHDITAIKLKEYELLEREAYLNSILNSAPNAIIVVNLDLVVTAINPEASRLVIEKLGVSPHTNFNFTGIVESGINNPYHDVLNRAFKGEVIEFFLITESKASTQYLEITLSPVKDYTGTIIGAKILIVDRTRTVQSEKALIESELKYKQLLDVIPGGILMTKMNGDLLYGSPTLNDILNVPRHYSLENYGYRTFIPNTDLILKKLKPSECDEDSSITNRITATKSDGTPIWLDSQSKLVKYNNEDVILSVIIDVSQTVRIEKEKKLNQKLYEILVESSLDGTDVIEIKGIKGNRIYELLIRNEKMKMFFDSDTKPFLKFSHLQARAPKYQTNGQLTEDVLIADWKSFKENRYIAYERLVYNVNGDLKYIFLSMQQIEFDDRTFIVRNFKDVTDLRKKDIEISIRALEIEKKNKVLEKYIESNISLEKFAYVTAHDLKSPIRTVISFAELLKRDIWDDLSPRNQTFIKIMIESSHGMYSLVEDVLSYSKIGTEKLKIDSFYLDRFLEFQTNQLQEEIKSKKACINFDLKVDTIQCDKVKLSQLLQNLIRNGMKFHRENVTPIVNISVSDIGKAWKFSIADNGIGIKKEYHDQIFTIFKQLNNKEQFSGNGIGLSTCQKIVDLWSGKIWVESKVGVGSTFFFTIPKTNKQKT